MNIQTIIAIVLAVVTGIVANLMTPYFKRFPSFFYSKYTKRRMTSLENDLNAVRAWCSNPADFYLYLLHIVLLVLSVILSVIILFIFVAIAPKFSLILVGMPAFIVYVIVYLNKTTKLIAAVRNLEEYETEILEKIKILKEKVH